MRKISLIAMAALALLLTFTQCKKTEKPAADEGVFITLNATMGQSEDRTDFDGSHFVWTDGADEYVYVGGSQHDGCFGVLSGTGNGTGNMDFGGYLTDMPQNGEALYFFYLGKGEEKTGNALTTLDFSNQDGAFENLTNYHIAVSEGIFYNNTLYFSATFQMISAFAYFDTQQFAGDGTVRLHGDDVYSTATVDFRNGKISGKDKGNIKIGQGTSQVYVALIPSTENVTTLKFDSGTKTGSIDFVRGIQPKKYYCRSGNSALVIPAQSTPQYEVNLSTLTQDYTVQNGAILTGTLDAVNNPSQRIKISIADGATVTLNGATINGIPYYNDEYWDEYYQYFWAGLTCLGDATIILEGENTVTGFWYDYPCIQAGTTGTTLTIKGTGSLTASASSDGSGAGIGGRIGMDCGNIEIQGGVITANGGGNAAGIGCASQRSCGDITISGGTVTAKGGVYAAGIGGGYKGSCGNITIYATVTRVTATKGSSESWDPPHNSIGAGSRGSCGTVTIGGVVGPITDSPYTYEP